MFVGGKATVVDIKDSTVGIMDKSDYTPGEERTDFCNCGYSTYR